MKLDKQDLKESLLVFGIFTGTLLPLRLVFYDYLSHYWLSSFGLTSLFVFGIFYLSKKGKLGKIGIMIVHKLEKRAKGKLGKFLIIFSVIMIYFWSLAVSGALYGNDDVAIKQLQSQGITDIKTLEQKGNSNVQTKNIPLSLLILFTPNDVSRMGFKVINELSNGWVLTFGSVILIDEIEVLALGLYLRYKKPSQIVS